MYHLHLHRWLEVFPRQQILIVNGDQLIEDPLSQLQRIETFLGIPHRITSNNFYFNETKGFYCLRNDSSDKCLRETKGRKHPHVDPMVITKLRRYFADHNQKFYELIGEDLGWPEEWGGDGSLVDRSGYIQRANALVGGEGNQSTSTYS